MSNRFGRWLTLAPFLISSLTGETIKIDAGSLMDSNFAGGTAFTIPSPPVGLIDSTLRYGEAFSYAIPAQVIPYVIEFGFVEPTVTAKGQRIFSVRVNNHVVIDHIDLYAEGGANLKPVTRAATVVGSAELRISFETHFRSAVVSWIKITPLFELYGVTPKPVGAGAGIISVVDPLGNQTLTADLANLLHLERAPGGPLPVVGSPCEISGAVVVGPDAVYFCAAVLPLSTNPAPWGRWIKVPAVTSAPSAQDKLLHDAAWAVINTRCTKCHGGTGPPVGTALTFAAIRKEVGDLDLRTRESMLAGGRRGPALKPGDLFGSLIFLYASRCQTCFLSTSMASKPVPPLRDLQTSAQVAGFALVPPDSSEESVGMPPFDPLSELELVAIRDWIIAGAP